MSTLPVLRPRAELASLPQVGPLDLHSALLADAKCPNSRSARQWDCKVFADFLGVESPSEACAAFIARGRAQANVLGLAYRQWMVDQNYAPGTINRRLATLRRIAHLARRFDLAQFEVDVENLAHTLSRDVRGPDEADFAKVWAYLRANGADPQGKRNKSLIVLMHDSALRVGEAVGLDLVDLELSSANPRVRIKGKGGVRVWVAISPRAVRHLREWVETRGPREGPVYTSHVRDGTADAEFIAHVDELRMKFRTWGKTAEALNAEGRPTPSGIAWHADRVRSLYWAAMRPRGGTSRLPQREVCRILRQVSEAVGLERVVRPHGLRHRSITAALDATNGDVRKVASFSRHVNIQHVLRYDDARRNFGAEITRKLGADDD